MNHYVYEITNLVNGKKYIGKRSCKCPIEDDKYMGSGYALKKAFDKYGKENFIKKIRPLKKRDLIKQETIKENGRKSDHFAYISLQSLAKLYLL